MHTHTTHLHPLAVKTIVFGTSDSIRIFPLNRSHRPPSLYLRVRSSLKGLGSCRLWMYHVTTVHCHRLVSLLNVYVHTKPWEPWHFSSFSYHRFSFLSPLLLPFSFSSKPQVLHVGSFSSISFTFNDMIIHISRLFQIITAFQSLFTLTSLPQMFSYILHAFSLSLNFHIFNGNNRKCFSSETMYNNMAQGQGEKKRLSNFPNGAGWRGE